MPIPLQTIEVPATTIVCQRTVSEIVLRFRTDGSNAVDMRTEFVCQKLVDGVVTETVPDGEVFHRFEELATWPEFPAVYQRIKDEVYARRAAQDAAVVAT